MTYYIRHKETGADFILKNIDVITGIVTMETAEESEYQVSLVDVIENYEFRYDIW